MRYSLNSVPRLVVAMACLLMMSTHLIADESSTATTQTVRDQLVDRGLKWLEQAGQAEDGTFSAKAGSGLTALAVTSALKNGRSPADPMVAKGLSALKTFVKPDGGIYGNPRLKNYETCVAMLCFSSANTTGEYNELLNRAKRFVTEMQYGHVAARDESDPWYGGSSYAGAGRPDLSNTAYFVEALKSMETPASDPAIQRALRFISRCQNLDMKYNDTQFADKVDDGGFYYYIPTTKIDPSTSPERFTPDGGLRSYGSMGYAGLKSMIFAGLTEEDPRVKAATEWIHKHYSVDSNPGMGSAGLCYYYHTFAASLNAANIDTLVVGDGSERDWRADLVAALKSRQADDGSWSNDNKRWMEGETNLATSFALLALSYCDDRSQGTRE